jgi:hypothetical protein
VTAPEVETIHLRGTGGIVWTYSLPLSPEIANQLIRHEMIRVNSDGSPWVEPETGEAPVVARPADGAVKSAWVGYAVWRSEQLGEPITVDAADAMTKTDIIDRYGKD